MATRLSKSFYVGTQSTSATCATSTRRTRTCGSTRRGARRDLTRPSGTATTSLAQDRAPGVAWEDMVEEVQDDWVYVALGKALARVHGLGVLHNDLHAGNVFVDVASQRVTLIDWGAATRGGDGGATLAHETRLFEGHAPLLQHAAHRRLVETVTSVR